jgi:hypothetical protein
MSRFYRLGCTLVLVGLLGGCASTRTASVPTKPLMQRDTQVDVVYVGYVNAIAKQRGTRVLWVNPPMKSIESPVATVN